MRVVTRALGDSHDLISADMMPYWVDMWAAIASRDLERMKNMIAVAREFLSHVEKLKAGGSAQNEVADG